ncbi:hypothetical protein D5086_016469 [Populus alba]|uniref:Uncharacterized protein n=1 Tax=Populus alba TaxID=43335 RepID=A0ACC4BUN5_POPAL
MYTCLLVYRTSEMGRTKEVVFWAPGAELKIHGPSFNESKVYRSPIGTLKCVYIIAEENENPRQGRRRLLSLWGTATEARNMHAGGNVDDEHVRSKLQVNDEGEEGESDEEEEKDDDE